MSVPAEDGGLRVVGTHARIGLSRRAGPLDLHVPTGSAVVLRGPNGSGKTCALAFLTGRVPPMAGTGHLEGRSLQRARRLGMVLGFGPDLLAPRTSRFSRWAEARRRCFGTGRAELRAAVERWEVSGYWDEPFSRLSAGMRWRCALAFAFAQTGVLICLDEPDAHLDRMGQELLAEELTAGLARSSCVGVVASHHLPTIPGVPDVAISWCKDSPVR
ncbi:MAG: ABC transporter ATP-binding protein [Microthrixaceae bacterium]